MRTKYIKSMRIPLASYAAFNEARCEAALGRDFSTVEPKLLALGRCVPKWAQAARLTRAGILFFEALDDAAAYDAKDALDADSCCARAMDDMADRVDDAFSYPR